MGIVMISCPETERAISTGIEVECEIFHSHSSIFQSYIVSVLPYDTRMVCQGCLGLRFSVC